MILFENNLVHDGYGEGFNCLRSSHMVIRGNRAGNVHSNPFYLDHCANVIVENNIAWGDLGGRWGANRAFAGVNVHNEDYSYTSTLRSSVNNIIRNNLITGTGYCIDAGQWEQSIQAGYKLGFHFYGNTCVGLQRRNVLVYPTTNVERILIQNNIFYSPGSMEGSCAAPNKPGITFLNNLWDGGNIQGPCTSAGDLTEDPKLQTPLAEFARLSSSNLPRPAHFALSANSPVLGRGRTVDVGGVERLAEYNGFQSLVRDQRCEVTVNGLPHDYFCVDRRSPPSLGAMDRSKYPPRPPVVIVPAG